MGVHCRQRPPFAGIVLSVARWELDISCSRCSDVSLKFADMVLHGMAHPLPSSSPPREDAVVIMMVLLESMVPM